MALLDLLRTRQREVACTAWLALACKDTYPPSIRWSEDEDRSTTFMTRYLEAVRRSPGHRCGKINARVMEGGTQQKRKAGLERENPRTMRRNTVLSLGEELADRAQQRIVSITARDCCHLCDGRSTSCVFEESLEGTGGGHRCRIYGYLPAMRHHQGELSHDDEQAK